MLINGIHILQGGQVPPATFKRFPPTSERNVIEISDVLSEEQSIIAFYQKLKEMQEVSLSSTWFFGFFSNLLYFSRIL